MRVLITGCSSGIGKATAAELVARGHEVFATARELASLVGLEGACKIQLDVTSCRSVASAAAEVGSIDALVNNAGISLIAPVEIVDLDAARHLFETNVLGLLRVTQAFLPAMRQRRRGTIVNVSSASTALTNPLSAIYTATKRAVEAISETLALEVGHLGVNVAILQPGRVASDIVRNTRQSPIDLEDYRQISSRRTEIVASAGINAAPAADSARQIAEIVESASPDMYRIGDEAEERVRHRGEMSHAEYFAAIRQLFGIAN